MNIAISGHKKRSRKKYIPPTVKPKEFKILTQSREWEELLLAAEGPVGAN